MMKKHIFFFCALALLLCSAAHIAEAKDEPWLLGDYYIIRFSPEEVAAEQELIRMPKRTVKKPPQKSGKKQAKSNEGKSHESLMPEPLTRKKLAERSLLAKLVNNYVATRDEGLLAPTAPYVALSKTRIIGSHFYTPMMSSDAYRRLMARDVEKAVPQGEVAAQLLVFRGEATAPRRGLFRFVGTATDFILVRFNGDIVLQAGDWLPSLWKVGSPQSCVLTPESKHMRSIAEGKAMGAFHKYALITDVPGIPTWNARQGGLTAGSPISVQEDKDYPIEIIVGTMSREMGMLLYIEDIENPPSSPHERELFRKSYRNPPDVKHFEENGLLSVKEAAGVTLPPYSDKSAVWTRSPQM